MSLFEKYLTLGQWLTEEERLALYKYLLKTQKVRYNLEVNELLINKNLKTNFANGEIFYFMDGDFISYKARRIGSDENPSEIRSLPLSRFNFANHQRIRKFFAQCEIDVLRNFPIPGEIPLEDRSYGINVYPFYDLNYFSNGDGKAKGLLKKIQSRNDEFLGKLLAS